jgi:hypothetical protein
VLSVSDTLTTGTNWPATADGLRKALMHGRNQIHPQTWKTNYQPYVAEALRNLSSQRPPIDGHGLLQRTLEALGRARPPAVRPAASR